MMGSMLTPTQAKYEAFKALNTLWPGRRFKKQGVEADEMDTDGEDQ